MVKERKCSECGKIVYRTNLVDDKGSWTLTLDSPARHFRQQEGRLFMDCPHCGKSIEFISVGPNKVTPID